MIHLYVVNGSFKFLCLSIFTTHRSSFNDSFYHRLATICQTEFHSLRSVEGFTTQDRSIVRKVSNFTTL